MTEAALGGEGTWMGVNGLRLISVDEILFKAGLERYLTQPLAGVFHYFVYLEFKT